MSVFARRDFWTKQTHYLDRMGFKELIPAFFQHYTIQTYLALAVLSVSLAAWAGVALLAQIGIIAAVLIVYPLVWYILHRFVLHGTWMFKIKSMASLWKRVHYDHHQDPHNLEVLFGALYTTLPTIAAVTLPIGWLFAGWPGAAYAFGAGMVFTVFNEFVHCVQHLSIKPKNRFLKAMKQRHMAHHFHHEKGNYGITDFTWDRLFGTFYRREDRPHKSRTVFNLGYDREMAARYPWVAELSGGVGEGHPRDRRPS